MLKRDPLQRLQSEEITLILDFEKIVLILFWLHYFYLFQDTVT